MDTVVAKGSLQSIQPKLIIEAPNGRFMRTSYTYDLVTNSCLGIWLGAVRPRHLAHPGLSFVPSDPASSSSLP
jgi:hypothetical protein